MSYQQRQPAQWNLVKENDNFKCYLSEGGAVKFTHVNNQGTEIQLFMFPARQASTVALMGSFFDECLSLAHDSVEQRKAQREQSKLVAKVQVEAQKATQSLQALGLTQEQIIALLAKAV